MKLHFSLLLVSTLGFVAQYGGNAATVTPITIPGATSLAVTALNQAGQLAGDYHVGGPAPRAFLWSAGTSVDLGTLGGTATRVFGLNNNGDVTGQSLVSADAEAHAFLYTQGVMVDLGTLGAAPSFGTVINDLRQVAGYSYLMPGSLEAHSFIVGLGAPLVDIGTLGGQVSSPAAMNLLGQVVGSSSTFGDMETHGYLHMAGFTFDLGTLGGTFSFATAINLFGQVTGGATLPGDTEIHAFQHDGFSPMNDLGTLGGTFSQGYAINDAGQILGDSTTAGDAENHAFLYTGGMMTDLGTLGGGFSTGLGLNGLGQVVGSSYTRGGQEHAFLWENGTMTDLNALLPANSGWELHVACYINDAGHIVGTGVYQGQPAWFFFNPQGVGNQPPVANAGPDQTFDCVTTNVLVTFDARDSSDPDGGVLVYEWLEGSRVRGTMAQLEIPLAPGTHTFTLRVTDTHGAVAEDTVVARVGDVTLPTLTCPTNRSAEANGHGKARVPNFLRSLVALDNCTPTNLVRMQTPPAGTVVGCGTTFVTVTVADAASNTATCLVEFLVMDVTPPVIRCPDELVKRAGTNGLFAVLDLRNRVSDNCTPDEELVVVQTPAPGTLVSPGQYVIVLHATDAAGNENSCSTPLTVVDRTRPIIHSLEANPQLLVAGQGAMVAVTLAVVATDNCDPAPLSRIVSVTSSDPVTGEADVTSPDWNVTGDLTLELRAERSAPNRSRVYAVRVSSTDASGNVSMRTVHIPVKKTAAAVAAPTVTTGVVCPAPCASRGPDLLRTDPVEKSEEPGRDPGSLL